MSGPLRSLFTLLLGLLLTQSGCVALNIPSQRLHDPDDHGGIVGHWKGAKHREPNWVKKFPGMDPLAVERAAAEGAIAASEEPIIGGFSEFHGAAAFCTDCDSETYDPLASTPALEQPEVPWPKYHPVPTRAVFGVPISR